MPKKAIVPMLVLLATIPLTIKAQDSSQQDSSESQRVRAELTYEYFKQSTYINILKNRAKGANNELGLDQNQAKQILEEVSKHAGMIENFTMITGGNPNQSEHFEFGMGNMIDQLNTTAQLLDQQVLNADQRRAAQGQLFTQLVSMQQGNTIGAIVRFYRKSFGLTDRQVDKSKEVEKELAEELLRLKREYEQKVKEAVIRSNAKFSKVMTPRQQKMLTDLSSVKTDE